MPADEPLTRTRMVAAARSAIERDGVERLSLRGVARSLGVTAPALYAHVPDKRALVAAVATEYFDELAARFAAVETTHPLERVRVLSRAYVAHALASPNLFHLLFRYAPGTPGLDVDGADSFAPATRVVEIATRATNEAIRAGALTVTDPLEAALTMWAAIHGVAEVLLMGFAFDDATADRLVESVITTVLIGQGAEFHKT